MNRKEIGVLWDRLAREGINHNDKVLFNALKDFVGTLSDEAFRKVLDASKINRKEPVTTKNDLPSSAVEGEARMVRDTGIVYRYNGNNWVEIEQLDASAFNELDNRISDKFEEVESINPSIASLWNPPNMPDTLRGNGKVPSGYNPDQHLDALLEPLVNDDFVTRKDLGKTADGEYTIRRYDFTPENYEKTIVITAGLHGNEYTAFYSLAQFLELLVTRWHEFPQLAYLRKNVRIITIPIINMWGFANQKRQNVNGVDLNRNFPMYWDDFPSDKPGNTYFKGSAPLSEAESKVLNTLLNDFKEATSHFDLHTTTVVEGEYVFYHPRFLKNQTRGIEKLTHAFKKNGERVVWSASRLPSFTTHAIGNFNMNGGNPEFVNGISGGIRSSVEMTRAMKWYGNIIIEAARMEKPSAEMISEPFTKVVRYTKTKDEDAISFTSRIFNNIDQTYLTFPVNTPGILMFDGHVTFSANSFAEGKTATFFPHLYQQGGHDADFDTTKDRPQTETNVFIDKEGTYTAPLSGQLITQVTSDGGQRVGNVVVRLRGKTSGGRITLENYFGRITFIPSSTGKRFEIYDSTGRESKGVEGMAQVFPDY